MRKYINELSNKELEKVYDTNKTLQDMVDNDVISRFIGFENISIDPKSYFVGYYAREELSQECFIEGDKYTLYEQTTYDYDTGKVVCNEPKPVKKIKQKEYER